MKKNPQSTSFRSEIHATDSTRNGCHANNAATAALRHVAPDILFKTRNNNTAFAAWNNTFTRCSAPGFAPPKCVRHHK